MRKDQIPMMDEIGEGLNSLESKGKFGIDGPE
jgi:hypothetical protein